jgi:hypothetical protein
MISVHENVPKYKTTKPVECPSCTNKRAFDVPVEARVRSSRRGGPPPESSDNYIILKCKKCNNRVGVSMEHG